MTLREILDNAKQSEIYKLRCDGKIIGLRVKRYNVNTGQFEYYDFETSIILNMNVRNFINGLSMKTIELNHVNGLLMSEAEVRGEIIVGNFETEAEAVKALQPFIRIYKLRG